MLDNQTKLCDIYQLSTPRTSDPFVEYRSFNGCWIPWRPSFVTVGIAEPMYKTRQRHKGTDISEVCAISRRKEPRLNYSNRKRWFVNIINKKRNEQGLPKVDPRKPESTFMATGKNCWGARSWFLGRHPVLCLWMAAPALPEWKWLKNPIAWQLQIQHIYTLYSNAI